MKNFIPWQGGAMPMTEAEMWVQAVVAVLGNGVLIRACGAIEAGFAASMADLIVQEYRKRVEVSQGRRLER